MEQVTSKTVIKKDSAQIALTLAAGKDLSGPQTQIVTALREIKSVAKKPAGK